MNNKDIFRVIIKMAIKEAKKIVDDQEALDVQILYPTWSEHIGETVNVGEYFQHDELLYKCINAHVIQADWAPHITPSLWTVIDKEHAGTLEDPIPWKSNMEAFQGKYYIENNLLYLCIRDSGMALNFDCAELIGIYFNSV